MIVDFCGFINAWNYKREHNIQKILLSSKYIENIRSTKYLSEIILTQRLSGSLWISNLVFPNMAAFGIIGFPNI